MADLLHSRGSGEPTYSLIFTDAATSYSPQPSGNEPCISAEEPKAVDNTKEPKAAEEPKEMAKCRTRS
jgi:hypothetical protein